jgi:hypothetical protein
MSRATARNASPTASPGRKAGFSLMGNFYENGPLASQQSRFFHVLQAGAPVQRPR